MKSVSSRSEVSFGFRAATTLPALMTRRWSANSSICGRLCPTMTRHCDQEEAPCGNLLPERGDAGPVGHPYGAHAIQLLTEQRMPAASAAAQVGQLSAPAAASRY